MFGTKGMWRVSRGIAIVILAGLGLGNVGLTSAAAAELPPGGTFADDDGSTHEGNIEAIAAEGITLGCNPPGNYRYCPADGVRRDQMAAFLARAFDLPRASDDFFTDDEGNTHEDSINRVAAAQISLGLGDGTYDPSSIVTREQMASFLARAMGLAACRWGPLRRCERNPRREHQRRSQRRGHARMRRRRDALLPEGPGADATRWPLSSPGLEGFARSLPHRRSWPTLPRSRMATPSG